MTDRVRAWLGETELTHPDADLDRDPRISLALDGRLELDELDVDTGVLGPLTVHIPAALMPHSPLVQTNGFVPIANGIELRSQPVGTMIRDSDTGEYWLRRDHRQLWHAPAAWAFPRRTDAFTDQQFPCQIVVMGNGVPSVD